MAGKATYTHRQFGLVQVIQKNSFWSIMDEQVTTLNAVGLTAPCLDKDSLQTDTILKVNMLYSSKQFRKRSQSMIIFNLSLLLN